MDYSTLKPNNKALFVLSNFSYPPNEGAHEQTAKTIIELSRSDRKISLIIITKSHSQFDLKKFTSENPNINVLAVHENTSAYSSLMSKRYLLQKFNIFTEFDKKILVAINSSKIDTVVLEGIPLSPLLKFITASKIIISPIDAWSLRQDRLIKASASIVKKFSHYFAKKFALRIEYEILPRSHSVHIVSFEDEIYLKKIQPAIKTSVIPVQFKEGAYAYSKENCTNKIIISGDLNVKFIYNGFISFCHSVLPIITKKYPSISFKYYCRTSPDEAIKKLCTPYKNIEFIEWADDLELEMSKSIAVLLIDSGGTGIKNRAVHALSTGTPLVASTHSMEGIPAENNINALIYSDTNSCIASLSKIISDEKLRNHLSQNGKILWEKEFSSNIIMQKWSKLLFD